MKLATTSLFFLVLLNGCTNLWITESETGPGEASMQREAFQSSQSLAAAIPQETTPVPTSQTPDVLVIWAIPTTAVDRYTIRYGFTRDSLTESMTVTTDALEKYQDPVHGFVYKYTLKGVPEDRSIFVSLIAHTGSESSPPSATFEIPAR